MFEECVIRGRRFAPARFCAPLAGYTHSAFRRLVAELGGCGALWTEMLAARQVLNDNFQASPWVRRRAHEKTVVFQLMACAGDPLDRILDRLGAYGADAVDLNLACHARAIRSCVAGSALFAARNALRTVIQQARRFWPGLLTAKIRLGSERPDWQPQFIERIQLLEAEGIDAVILHPRFFEDRFKRRARLELIPWAASLTRLPLIANGDLLSPEQVQVQAGHLRPACAIMVGRMAIVRPWLFATWDQPAPLDLGAIWRKMYDYILEDFPTAVALRRVQMFTKYYAANFAFGRRFYVAVSNAPTLPDILRCADEFFSGSPPTLKQPTVAGL